MYKRQGRHDEHSEAIETLEAQYGEHAAALAALRADLARATAAFAEFEKKDIQHRENLKNMKQRAKKLDEKLAKVNLAGDESSEEDDVCVDGPAAPFDADRLFALSEVLEQAVYGFLDADSLARYEVAFAGARADAARAAKSIDDPNLETQVARLLAHIAFEEDEVAECRAYLAKCPADDPDVLVDGACCDLKDGRHEAARAGFESARDAGGYQPDVAYNEALCAYRSRKYGPCLKHLAEIIERGVREHPELLVGAVTEGEADGASVGNTPALRATFLVEAFNLKAAVEFAMKNFDEAREALTDMPPRAEEELDPVTLHNVALMHMDTDPADGFDKLNFLVSSPDSVPAPPECFANLLLLYVSPAHGFHDLAADVLAEHPALAQKHLSADAYEYLDAAIAATRSPEEAYRRFERAASAKAEEMRGLAKSIQDARLRRDAERVKRLAARYDDALEAYIPFLMAQAKIYWDRAHYAQVEKIFRRSAEFCAEHETFRLNVAHTYFTVSYTHLTLPTILLV